MDLGIKGEGALCVASTRGIGFGCASALAQAGCHVVINGRNPDHGKAEKCDLCLSIDGDPECVKFCTPKALLFTDEDAGPKAKQAATALRMKEVYKEMAG